MTAVRLMYIGAALSLLSILTVFVTKSALRDQIAKNNSKLSSAQVDTAVNLGIGFTVVIGIIVAVVYVLLAMQVGKGKEWARIVTLVLTGIGVLLGLAGFLQPAPALNRVLSVIGLLFDIAIIVFLLRPDSSAYCKGRPAA